MSNSSDSRSHDKKIQKMGSSHVKSASARKSSSSRRKSHSGQSSSNRGGILHSSASRGPHKDPGASSSAAGSSLQELPRSVRNAPPELRAAIRRRQNNESAKRSRERKYEEQKEIQRKFVENSKRIENLEKQVDDLTNILSKKKSSKKKDNSDRYPDDPGSPSGNPGFYGDPF